MLQPNVERLESVLKDLSGACFSLKDEVRHLEICTYLLDMVLEQMDNPDETTFNRIHLLVSAFKTEFQDYQRRVCRDLSSCRTIAQEAIEDLHSWQPDSRENHESGEVLNS